MEIVFTTWDNIEAGFIKSLLEASEIECFVQNLYYSSLVLAGSGAVPITIAVRLEDKENAKEIINQYYEDMKETSHP